ncbi:MAG: hypothetical protein WCB74_25470 [Pseudolabrys sp.]
MRRRDFIKAISASAAAWPLAARAQQSAMPVIAFLRSTSAAGSEHLVAALEQGLKEAGFVAGQNVAIDYRWGNDQLDRLVGGRSHSPAAGRHHREYSGNAHHHGRNHNDSDRLRRQ